MPRSADASEARAAVRHGRQRKSSPLATIGKFLVAAVAVVAVSATAVAGVAAVDLAKSVKPTAHLAGETPGAPPPNIGAIEGGVNLLLVGSDSGDGNAAYGERDENLNDVTILMHISADHSSASVVSFPRDMYVHIAECANGGDGRDKMNTALTYGGKDGGLACAVSTVEGITGLKIPFAAQIGFDGVISMSNAVGGVPVCITEPLDDAWSGIQLDVGTHELSGSTALAFLRSRHGVGDGSDLSRISNQQIFLSSLVRTLKSGETLSNPVKLYSIARAALKNVTLSESLANIDTMVSIASALKDIPLDRVSFVQIPTDQSGDGVVATDDASLIWQALQNDQAINLTATGKYVVTDPNAPPTSTDAASEPATPADPSADPSATSPGVVDLPASVTGQSAAQATCTAGRPLENQ
ncbi:LCP family protein [Plantibacter sp. Mn2098]|uniref:LCP family glycopolymer transferase n=1 Tax=Plantibacter sp. Mn2098 TaxID=3395266 RepID=UPI003BD88AAC